MTPDTRPIPRPEPEHTGPVNGHPRPLPWTYDPASDGPIVRRLLGDATSTTETGLWIAITPEGAARLLVATEAAGDAAERARTRRLIAAAVAVAALLALLAWLGTRPAGSTSPSPVPSPPPLPSPAATTVWANPPQPDTLPARYAPWRSL